MSSRSGAGAPGHPSLLPDVLDEGELSRAQGSGLREEGQAVDQARGQPPATSILDVIARAARDPAVDVSKMEALFRLQRELIADQAKAEFNAAFARLAPALPRIKKNGTIEIPGDEAKKRKAAKILFAKWEDIDTAIRPLLLSEGFSLSFNTAQRPGEGGGLVVTARLRHSAGHYDESSIPVPLDTGPGRNNLQAYGSSLSYGKRYAACALLNIVTEGEDDDGVKGGAEPRITEQQYKELAGMIAQTGANLDAFCRTMAVESLSEMPASVYPVAVNMLIARRIAVDSKRRREQA